MPTKHFTVCLVCVATVTALACLPGVLAQGEHSEDDILNAPLVTDGCTLLDTDPVLIGYDTVAYHFLPPYPDGVGIVGSPDFKLHFRGYEFWFATAEHRAFFVNDPERYAPAWGGHCSWGVARELASSGWPWSREHLGPPGGPVDGWAVVGVEWRDEPILLFNIWASYTDMFMSNPQNLPDAKERWEGWFGPGSVHQGPFNTHCIGTGAHQNWCIDPQSAPWLDPDWNCRNGAPAPNQPDDEDTMSTEPASSADAGEESETGDAGSADAGAGDSNGDGGAAGAAGDGYGSETGDLEVPVDGSADGDAGGDGEGSEDTNTDLGADSGAASHDHGEPWDGPGQRPEPDTGDAPTTVDPNHEALQDLQTTRSPTFVAVRETDDGHEVMGQAVGAHAPSKYRIGANNHSNPLTIGLTLGGAAVGFVALVVGVKWYRQRRAANAPMAATAVSNTDAGDAEGQWEAAGPPVGSSTAGADGDATPVESAAEA